MVALNGKQQWPNQCRLFLVDKPETPHARKGGEAATLQDLCGLWTSTRPASPTTDTLPPESVFPFYLHLSVPSTNLQTFGKLSSFLLWLCGFQFSFLVLETHICFWNTRIRIIVSAIFHLTVPLATRSCSVLELPVCHSVLFIFLSPIVNCQFCLIVGF